MKNELLNAQSNSENIVLLYIIQPVSVTPRHCVLNYTCTVCYIQEWLKGGYSKTPPLELKILENPPLEKF